ncbi:MAG TPA: hypothetical protein VM143_17830 [Acidimicrobiales bacterium]|nr:hypothetical protein [Acidimicrobiales bacterium]
MPLNERSVLRVHRRRFATRVAVGLGSFALALLAWSAHAAATEVPPPPALLDRSPTSGAVAKTVTEVVDVAAPTITDVVPSVVEAIVPDVASELPDEVTPPASPAAAVVLAAATPRSSAVEVDATPAPSATSADPPTIPSIPVTAPIATPVPDRVAATIPTPGSDRLAPPIAPPRESPRHDPTDRAATAIEGGASAPRRAPDSSGSTTSAVGRHGLAVTAATSNDDDLTPLPEHGGHPPRGPPSKDAL